MSDDTEYILTDADGQIIPGERYDNEDDALDSRARLMGMHEDGDQVTVEPVDADEPDRVYVVITGDTKDSHENVEAVYGTETAARQNAFMEVRPELREDARNACPDPLENGPAFADPETLRGYYVDVYEAPYHPGGRR